MKSHASNSFARIVIGLACLSLAGADEKKQEVLLGFDCNEQTPCKAVNENCSDGYCKCGFGYVRNDKHCFPERTHGESCFFDVQCTIFPMVCAEKADGIKRCECHKFFTWSEISSECKHADNISAMVSKLEQQWDYEKTISGEADTIFPGILAAGFMVLVILAVLATSLAVYGCYWGSWKCRNSGQDKQPLAPKTVQRV